MKLYKDNNNNVFAYELDGSQDKYIGDKTPITRAEAEVINAATQVNKFNTLSYEEKRAAEYPPIADYLDGIVKGDQSQIDAYIAKCLEVKAKYPK